MRDASRTRNTKRSPRLRAIDLFSGCGGLSLGLRQAGFDVIGAIEIDSLAAETYKVNHKKVVLWEKDIQTVSPLGVKRRLHIQKGELDLLAGCPPCQGFSSMRTLNGGKRIVDSRKNLVFEFLRFVREFMPKAIMMENVPGLAEDARIKEVKRELESLGYWCEYRVLDASFYGVPQRRRRMILLGGQFGAIPFAKPAKAKVTVREAIEALPRPGKSGDPVHDLPEDRSPHVQRRQSPTGDTRYCSATTQPKLRLRH